jgi:glycosyltransferase involved in cell wall biosynthesis
LKIAHIITSLNAGGAENALQRMVSLDKKNNHLIISLLGEGLYGKKLSNQGVRIISLNMKKSQFSITSLLKLIAVLKKENPAIIQSWMYHSDLIGGVAAFFSGKKIIWGIRGPLYKKFTSNRTLFIAKLCAVLSHILPTFIIANSIHARDSHILFGYSKKKMHVIHNGFNTKPVSKSRASSRISRDTKHPMIIGTVGRYDPHKDHLNLINALHLFNKKNEDFIAYFIGEGLDESNEHLVNVIKDFGLEKKIKLIGLSNDVQQYYSMMDIFILSSEAESFPNVIGEAMISGVPCISTDVGDAKAMIGENGWIVPIQNPIQLSNAISKAYNDFQDYENWSERKHNAKEIIKLNFSIDLMLNKFNKLWSQINESR